MTLVLDFGCANTSMTAIRKIKGYVPIGADIGRRDCLPMVVYDGQKLPFRDETFDIIVSQSVVEHVVDLERYFYEAFRVMKKHGKFFVEGTTRSVAYDRHHNTWFRHWLGNNAAGVYLRWPWHITSIMKRYFNIRNMTKARLRMQNKLWFLWPLYIQSWILTK